MHPPEKAAGDFPTVVQKEKMKRREEFQKLIDEAIEVADGYRKSEATADWLKSDCDTFIENLKKISQWAKAEADIRSEGAGLGITRFLSEIQAPEDLYAAGRAIEVFFQEEMK